MRGSRGEGEKGKTERGQERDQGERGCWSSCIMYVLVYVCIHMGVQAIYMYMYKGNIKGKK